MTDFEVRTLFKVLSSIKTKRGGKTSVMVEELRVPTSKNDQHPQKKEKDGGFIKYYL
ncbi:MAG: hypothetical protein M1300_05570 [Epsilonproteobacteria bacterium]|nr:hypothetical protein [Campylobacterota bacterium]